MSKGVAITYGDIAPGAKENFNIDASESKFATLANLRKYNMKLYGYANPCEQYQTALDGTAVALSSPPNTANIGLWSNQLSNNDGTFAEPITLILESKGQYSSQGFTFTFDKFNDIFPTRLTIQWLRVTSEGVEDLLDGEVEFTPNSGMYFCRKQVDYFNKVIIKFYSLNMPKNRLKLEVIDYGFGTVFRGNELRNVQISQHVDPISSEIKISTCEFTLDSGADIVYSFQTKQPISITFGDELLATMFVKTSKRKARFLWDVTAEDYIGVMDSSTFVGGMYDNIPASTIMRDIFTTAKVPYSIDDKFDGTILSGYIPYTTCREALMQVCFASIAIVNTANTDVVEIKTLDNDIKQTIPLNRIMQGQNFENGDTVTEVTVASHQYKQTTEAGTVTVYNANDNGIGKNIYVKFTEPLHSLKIVFGEILESGVNYAIINANDVRCSMGGYKYEYSQVKHSRKNPFVLADELDNVKEITTAKLVSLSNANDVLDNCYNWLTRTDTTNMKIVVGKDINIEEVPVKYGKFRFGTAVYGNTVVTNTESHKDVKLGECIDFETEYLGIVSGRSIQQSFNLNGNIIVKEVVIK